MWIRIRSVIVEDEPLAAQYLAALLDDTCQVEVVGTATESETGLQLCAEQTNEVLLEERLRFQRRRCRQGTENQIYFARLQIFK